MEIIRKIRGEHIEMYRRLAFTTIFVHRPCETAHTHTRYEYLIMIEKISIIMKVYLKNQAHLTWKVGQQPYIAMKGI